MRPNHRIIRLEGTSKIIKSNQVFKVLSSRCPSCQGNSSAQALLSVLCPLSSWAGPGLGELWQPGCPVPVPTAGLSPSPQGLARLSAGPGPHLSWAAAPAPTWPPAAPCPGPRAEGAGRGDGKGQERGARGGEGQEQAQRLRSSGVGRGEEVETDRAAMASRLGPGQRGGEQDGAQREAGPGEEGIHREQGRRLQDRALCGFLSSFPTVGFRTAPVWLRGALGSVVPSSPRELCPNPAAPGPGPRLGSGFPRPSLPAHAGSRGAGLGRPRRRPLGGRRGRAVAAPRALGGGWSRTGSPGGAWRMEIEHLQRLREANQDLLQRLRMKQEEIRKRLPIKPALNNKTAPESSVPLPTRRKTKPADAVVPTADPAVLVSVEPGACAGRAALCSSLKDSSSDRGVQQQQAKMQEAVGLDSGFPGKEKNVVPVTAVVTCGRETSEVERGSHAKGRPEKESFPLGHGENRKQSTLLDGFHEKKQLESDLASSLSSSQGEETSKQHVVVREPVVHKSTLLTPQSQEPKKKAGHVTFESDPEEYTVPVSTWAMRPFLGYDWIAGLLDTSPSVAEKSDQYFAELHEFRQVNREECIHEQRSEPRAVDYIDPEQEPDVITSSHKCVYCYRLNQRLFPVPVDSESACPVCKIPRTHWPPEKLGEPAYVRVSIPRSTLLPAYKHKAHRRKSFEPEDSLALPSHCLAGWKNIMSCSNPMLSSLDLRACLEEKPPHHPCLNLVSRVSGGTRTDQLLNLTGLAHFRLSSASQQRGSKPNQATREQLQISA